MKIRLHGVHLLECTFRHVGDPFADPTKLPDADATAEIRAEMLKGAEEHHYAVRLYVALKPPSRYEASIVYVSLLMMDPDGKPIPENFEKQIMATGASIAFPYCRDMLSNLTSRGRFGPVWLNPVNFSAAFLQPTEPISTETPKR